ncbi:protein translocase subunit SecF [Corynebacterium sp. MSK032]|uniref:protein translocase subunit SecF n=1 Tax=Corynebacterium sp. MSK032 TaxID=3050191 RepID=UPI00254E87A8|nr:protein translocase subunit SecF [Corynebacterium sp. MSK032]MDK8793504.1 protein translocase subunit SecF [Corynebacterium sp. MSK032]
MNTTQTNPALTSENDAANEDSFFRRLYTGEGGINIVGNRKRWYQIAIAVIVVALASMLIRGFSFGIDFEGGTKMTMPPASVSTEQAEEVFTDATGVKPELVQIIGSGEGRILEITSEKLTQDEINSARVALNDAFKPVDAQGEQTPDAIGDSTVSESWGSSITNRMLLAAVVFLGLVFAYITIRFERDMAISAILALAVDAIVIMGIYALIGLDVTPATIIGLLTVLSFSLYDTVVVFDKVDENTAGYRSSTRRSYAELVNLAVNQTIMRSINTTVSTLLPILALMIIAVGMLGVGTLKDLALVQLIGIIQGTFSSIFLASPLLVTLKSRQREYRKHDEAVLAARTKVSAGEDSNTESAAADAAEGTGAEDASTSEMEQSTPKRTVKTPKLEGDENKPLSWRPGQ